jgi:hypothetical protein
MQDIFNILDQEEETDYILSRNENRVDENPINDLTIRELIKKEDTYIHPPNPILLPIPFSLMITGTKGSGKTLLTQNIIAWYRPYFDNIFIFSPTVYLDTYWQEFLERMRVPRENIFKHYNEFKVRMLLLKLENLNVAKEDRKDRLRTLMIFDDIVDEIPKGKKISAMNVIARNHRHYDLSTILLTQTFKAIDNSIRTNSTGHIVFNIDNNAERKKIMEELSNRFKIREFEELYNKCTCVPYGYIFINKYNKKIYKNFKEEIGSFMYDDERSSVMDNR